MVHTELRLKGDLPKSPVSLFIHAVNCEENKGATQERFKMDCSVVDYTDCGHKRYKISMFDSDKLYVLEITFTWIDDEPIDISVGEHLLWTSQRERVKLAKTFYKYYKTYERNNAKNEEARVRALNEESRQIMASIYLK